MLLKVLDLMKTKLSPAYYILKRWTREARLELYKTIKEEALLKNPKLDAMLRYRFLSYKFLNLTYPVASSLESCLLVDSTLDCLGKKLGGKINASSNILSDSRNAQQEEDLLREERLKKKDVQPRSAKRKRNWVDKLRKFKKKVPNEATNNKFHCLVHKKDNGGELVIQDLK